jgi:hypothetical protein
MTQSSSWTPGLSPVPKSARKWARSAHLHQVVKSPPADGSFSIPSSTETINLSSRLDAKTQERVQRGGEAYVSDADAGDNDVWITDSES